jgi:hypothetical protein
MTRQTDSKPAAMEPLNLVHGIAIVLDVILGVVAATGAFFR